VTGLAGLRTDEVRAFAEFVAGGEEVQLVSRLLLARGLFAMPIKGALLQRLIYEEPAERRIKDVDILVAPGSFGAAVQVLEDAGYQRGEEPVLHHQVTLRRPGAVLAVDLHGSLFEAGRYRMPTEDVFERAGEDEALFSTPIKRMHELDLYAHTIGKIASDHVGLTRPAVLEDLRRLGEVSARSPQEHARHLDLLGMGRAARYALSLLQARSPTSFAGQVGRALRPDILGATVARAVVFSSVRHGKFSTISKMGGILLASSLSASVRLGMKGLGRRRQRLA